MISWTIIICLYDDNWIDTLLRFPTERLYKNDSQSLPEKTSLNT